MRKHDYEEQKNSVRMQFIGNHKFAHQVNCYYRGIRERDKIKTRVML